VETKDPCDTQVADHIGHRMDVFSGNGVACDALALGMVSDHTFGYNQLFRAMLDVMFS
jgi:hypothetical protein